ncbi:Uncharacterised protein [Brevundimonas vesicularis]|uniref:Uncharacterized protein n=1 Tax=Brevundimonas vesicularis TaxID=41276 RepID=A0A2X1BDH5_BREVE|nr:Uncharacterised protein [Brevundimonas vesicularis]
MMMRRRGVGPVLAAVLLRGVAGGALVKSAGGLERSAAVEAIVCACVTYDCR